MVDISDYTQEKECTYKDERYSARDNGSVYRHPREGKRARPTDGHWTFGKPNNKTGYMEIGAARIHIIVATAFYGPKPTKIYVVDHVDANRRNNRIDNLRWLTRLENVLANPISRKNIEFICGCSAEEFLANPEIYRDKFPKDTSFGWMRSVSAEEGAECLKNRLAWAQSDKVPSGGSLGEWIYQPINTQNNRPETPDYIMSLTPRAAQKRVFFNDKPNEYPSTPQEISSNPLSDYAEKLQKGAVFFRNHNGSYLVSKSQLSRDGQSLIVMTESGYVWRAHDNGDYVPTPIADLPKDDNLDDVNYALNEVTYKDDLYIHSRIEVGFLPKEYLEQMYLEYTSRE